MQISRTMRALSNGTFGYYCPGCQALHATPNDVKLVGWNTTAPTFDRSVTISRFAQPSCHHTIKDGQITFLSDCRHKLRGTTVELPNLPEEYQDVPRRA